MRRETGDQRVWVDDLGVHCDTAGARLDMEWGCGLAELATRDDVRAHIVAAHGEEVLAEVVAAVAAELAAQVPGSPEEAARRERDQLIGAPIFAEWLASDQRAFFAPPPGEAEVTREAVTMDGASEGSVERLRTTGARGGATIAYAWERASWNPHTPARVQASVRFSDGPRRLRLDVGGGQATWSAAGFAPDDDARIADMVEMLIPTAVREPDGA